MEDLNISIKWGTKTMNVKISSNSTLLDLRKELQNLTGVPLEMQKLMFKGLLKGDEKTLTAHKITNNSKLMLTGAALKEIMAVVSAQETSKEMDDPSQMKASEIPKDLPPFWRLPPYTSTMIDPFLEGVSMGQLKRGDSIMFYNFIFKRVTRKALDPSSRESMGLNLLSQDDASLLKEAATILDECSEWAQVAQEVEAPDQFLKVVEDLKSKLENLKQDQLLFIPGGWEGLSDGGTLMHIIQRTSPITYSFTTCNPSTGLEYHQQSVADPPKMKHQTSIKIENIPATRFLDLGFWTALLCVWMKQSEYHRVEVIYDVLLPWLSEQSYDSEKGQFFWRSFASILVNKSDEIDWRTKCRSSGSSGIRAIWEAVRYMLRSKGLSPQKLKQLSFVIRKEMLLISGEDLITRFASKYESAADAITRANLCGIIPDPENEKLSGDLNTGFDHVEILYQMLNFKGSLIRNDNSLIDTKVLSKKKRVLGIYFSASWCAPCQSFTKQLVNTYKLLQKQGKEFEIIFVSSDRDKKSFDNYFQEMPWLAVPFDNADLRKKIELRAKVKGIPTLLLFSSNGTFLSKDGRKIISEDPEGSQFPWPNSNKIHFDTVSKKLKNLINTKGENVSSRSFVNKVVGLYFSASWCAPCQTFTPILKNVHKKLQEKNIEFDIIFVSGDKDAESFQKYFQQMPWFAIQYEDQKTRAELGQMFQIKGIPTLILFDQKGNFLSSDGRKILSMDQKGDHYPWSDISALESEAGVAEESNPSLTLLDVKFLNYGMQLFGLTTNKEHKAGRLSDLGLRRMIEFLDSLSGLVNVIPQIGKIEGLPPSLHLERSIPFTKFPKGELFLTSDSQIPNVEKYCGKTWTPQHPVVANLLNVPEMVNSVDEALLAFEECHLVCNKMLERASQSGTSSRTVLQIQVVALITTLFLEVVPIPPPRDFNPERLGTIWIKSFTLEQQRRVLELIQKLALIFATMWQGVEHPTRAFDAERSLVSMAMLSLFDFVARMMPSDQEFSTPLTHLLSEDGGYAISSTCCPNQRQLELVAHTMELVNPVHTVARNHVIDYLSSVRRVTRHTIFTFRQEEIITEESVPTFSIEILKYGSCVSFLRKLMQRHNLHFEPQMGQPEMVGLMQWFSSSKSDLAKVAPEFGLMRDMAATYKFLATMQTRESELMQRCAGKGNTKHWSQCLSSNDAHLGSNKSVYRFSNEIPPLKWELANVRGQDLNMADLICRLGERVLYFGEGPVVHSPADLSAIIEKPRPSEDDVLHSTKLPKFGDTLRREESETLCSYLSVPYARIPLVLSFFASHERTTYLFNPQLRDILRAVLFEGSTWVSANNRGEIEQIPVRRTEMQHQQWINDKMMNAKIKEEIDVLGTPQGNLLNELHCSPHSTLESLMVMFESINNLRNSSVHSADASFTLFLMELTINIQSYVAYAIQQEEAMKSKAVEDKNFIWDPDFGSEKNLFYLHRYYERVGNYLLNDIAPILHRWKQEATEDGDRSTLCVVHSYLALLWSHPLEFVQDTVVGLLGNICFVRNKHGFGLRRSRSDLMWAIGDDDISPRDRLLRFLQAYGVDTAGMTDNVLDEYVNTNRKGPLLLRIGSQSVIVPPLHRVQNLEELPPADVPEDSVFALLQGQRRSIIQWLVNNSDKLDETLNRVMRIALGNEDFSYTGWLNKGDGWFEAPSAQLKLDVQSAEIFWRNDVLKPVPDSMTQFLDFKMLWDRPQFQCGLVRRDENRHWVNLMDLPYELQEWTQEDMIDQGVSCPLHIATSEEKDDPGKALFLGIEYSRPFDLYSDLPHPEADERWATEFLKPVLLHIFPKGNPEKMMNYKLLLPTRIYEKDSDNCVMLGRELIMEDKKLIGVVWKEVIIYRNPKVVHVFNLISHGRRMWRSQIYSSDLKFSLQGLIPNEVLGSKSPPPVESFNSGGNFKQLITHSPSLVIVHRNTKIGGTEYYVPPRLLQGIIPSVFLETFHIWQGEDGILRGEPHVSSQWFNYRIEIKLEHSMATTTATIVRYNLHSDPTPISSIQASLDETGLRRDTSIHKPQNSETSQAHDYNSNVEKLLKSGFTRQQSIIALQNNDNDYDSAVSYLLDSSTKDERVAESANDNLYSTVASTQQESIENLMKVISDEQGFSTKVVKYALELSNLDPDRAIDWLLDSNNSQLIQTLDSDKALSEKSAELYLTSLSSINPDSCLSRLSLMLSRIEDISHILVWTSCTTVKDLMQIEIIELPRLKIKFSPRKDENDQVKLFLLEQSGWFISDCISFYEEAGERKAKSDLPGAQFLVKLLEGLSNCLILENSSHDLQLLMPNCDVYRPKSKEDPFTTNLIYNRGSVGWQQVMESRFYLYPVHTSKTFLLMNSLGASYYMALHRFLNRQYGEAFRLLESCHVDTDFTPEEQWVFDQFAHTSDDEHPDAHAVRLKISLCVLFSDNKLSWKVNEEMSKYLENYNHVSADCTLSSTEEKSILENCQRGAAILSNRLSIVEATLSSQPSTRIIAPPARLGGQPWLKLQSFSREYLESHGQPTTRLQYDPPGAGTLSDAGVLELLWEDKIISGEENGPKGFLFFYELLRGDFKVIMLGSDISRSFGEILVRYMQLKSARWGREAIQEGEREYEGSWQMVELGLMMNNPGVWPAIPQDHQTQDLLKIGVNLHRWNQRERSPLKSAFLDIIEAQSRLLMGTDNYFERMSYLGIDLKSTKDYADSLSRNFSIEERMQGSQFLERLRPRMINSSRNSFPLLPTTFLSTDKWEGDPLSLSTENILSFSNQPLGVIGLEKFVSTNVTISNIAEELPFDVRSHPVAQSIVAKDMLARVEKDVKRFAQQVKNQTVPCIIGLSENDIASFAVHPNLAFGVIELLDQLIFTLSQLEKDDAIHVSKAIERVNYFSNYVEILNDLSKDSIQRCRFYLLKLAGQAPKLDSSIITSMLLNENGLDEIITFNPFIKNPEQLLLAVSSIMFFVSRINQSNHIITEAQILKTLLSQFSIPSLSSSRGLSRSTSGLSHSKSSDKSGASDILERLSYASINLASSLTCSRYFVAQNGTNFSFDPRFLVFEYVFDILLRERQVEMVHSFLDGIAQGNSRVQQMLMGAGKTTVVGPLLTLILADGKQLVTHVMPTALLEQSRNILRNRFSSIIVKSIYTLNFERAVEDNESVPLKVWTKLHSAMTNRDIIVAAPESLKSVALKFVEQLHSIEIFSNSDSNFKPGTDDRTNREYMALQKQMVMKSDMADCIVRILDLWKEGVLIMDEVDVLLHPLKSELNFPIGFKEPIDLAGIRWDLPMHLIDAIFYHARGVLCGSFDVFDSAEKKLGKSARDVVNEICATIENGYRVHSLQRNPHIVLLDNVWYDNFLKQKIALWAYLGIYRHMEKESVNIPPEAILSYISGEDKTLHKTILEANLYPESLKLLNLTCDWVSSLFPHCLSKINRVAYGILSPEDIAAEDSSRSPQSRLLMAVPFVGKDVPSRSSEFAHPDALIGLTIMAYRYEGLRLDDLGTVIGQLKKDYTSQVGPRELRPACLLFQGWLKLAQRKGLGNSLSNSFGNTNLASSLSKSSVSKGVGGNILPLSLFQPGDKKQLRSLYRLVRSLPELIMYYLRQHVFPACLNFQATKISASGFELGSDILFTKRIGFSGTPSNLLPNDLGDCEYEPGSDGKIINTLTSSSTVTYSFLDSDWTAKKLLHQIATDENNFTALIDCGALITGMNNQEVAHFLLLHLSNWFEGVIYLDRQDRQMILLRSSGRSMLLTQCGIRPDKRFTFYDQVHTTGMDIKQHSSAKAVLTLGKDMTFRDYAQGAYRMRGIGKGQTIHLYIIPEVHNLINDEISHIIPSHQTLSNDIQPKTKKRKTEIDLVNSTKNILLDVPSWLFINSMRMETLQYIKLCSQELFNVWRKRALEELVTEVKINAWTKKEEGSVRLGRFRALGENLLLDSIALFREPLGFTVPDKVLLQEFFHDKLIELAQQFKVFTSDRPQLQSRVDSVLNNIGSVELRDVDMEKQNRDAHVVREQEQEAQEEAEEEAEQEEERESRYSREDEQPNPWPVFLLGKRPTLKRGEEAFYPFSEFQVRKEQPTIPFPRNLLLTDNFFRPSWISTGDRRLKNVTFILVWIPPTDHESELSMDVDKPLEEPYICALSLYEGETIRRIIHTQHPSVGNSTLLLFTLEGGILDFSKERFTFDYFSSNGISRDFTSFPLCLQSLKFINCEMYYENHELENLEKALVGASLKNRLDFFLGCLRLRRRERNLWDDTPLAKIFTPQSEWHLIRARSMLHQISLAIVKAIKTRKIPSPWFNPYNIFKEYDHDSDGNLTKDELISAFDSMNIDFSPADYYEISKLIPKNTNGLYPIENCADSLSLMSNSEIEAILVNKIFVNPTDKSKNNEKWVCKVCSYAHNPKWVVVCDACQHDLLGEPIIRLSGDEWSCGKCSLRNKKRDWFCEACWNARPSRFANQ